MSNIVSNVADAIFPGSSITLKMFSEFFDGGENTSFANSVNRLTKEVFNLVVWQHKSDIDKLFKDFVASINNDLIKKDKRVKLIYQYISKLFNKKDKSRLNTVKNYLKTKPLFKKYLVKNKLNRAKLFEIRSNLIPNIYYIYKYNYNEKTLTFYVDFNKPYFSRIKEKHLRNYIAIYLVFDGYVLDELKRTLYYGK